MSDSGVLVQDWSLDAGCAEALELAVDAARAVAEDAAHVGDALSILASGELAAVHHFTSEHPGYVGWRWCVALSRVEGGEPTVDEVWLEPGDGALQAPAWQPWSDRVRPGDLGAGDVFPTAADDPRLTAGFTAEDDLESVVADLPLHPLQWQLGLGRERVLSAIGRDDAAERWLSGEGGPDSAVARAATDRCLTCGWLMPIGGQLGQAFGVCAQPMSPSDGRVVSFDHGCGAHSEVVAEPSAVDVVEVVLDEVGFDTVVLEASVEPDQSEGDDSLSAELPASELPAPDPAADL